MIQMSPDGPVADPEIAGDDAVRRAAGDQSDDLVFPARELRKAVACCAGLIVQVFRRAQEDRLQQCEQGNLARSDRDAARSAPEAKVADVYLAVIEVEIDTVSRLVNPQEFVEVSRALELGAIDDGINRRRTAAGTQARRNRIATLKFLN